MSSVRRLAPEPAQLLPAELLPACVPRLLAPEPALELELETELMIASKLEFEPKLKPASVH